MSEYVFKHNVDGGSPNDEQQLKHTTKTIDNIKKLSDFTSPIDTMKSKILFCPDLCETKATVENMTLDDIYWMFEQITIKDRITEAYRYDMEKANKQQ